MDVPPRMRVVRRLCTDMRHEALRDSAMTNVESVSAMDILEVYALLDYGPNMLLHAHHLLWVRSCCSQHMRRGLCCWPSHNLDNGGCARLSRRAWHELPCRCHQLHRSARQTLIAECMRRIMAAVCCCWGSAPMRPTGMGWPPLMPCPCIANSVCIDACTSSVAVTFRQTSPMFEGLLPVSGSNHTLPRQVCSQLL